MSKHLLLVGFLDSPHFARWLEIIANNTTYGLSLFSSSPGRTTHEKITSLMNRFPERIAICPESPKRPWFTYLLDKFLFLHLRKRGIARAIQRLKPDLIHFFEMQHSGYLLDQVLPEVGAKYAYSNYGSDIFWFSKKAKHKCKMKRILSNVDLVFYECDRDLGFIKSSVKEDCILQKTVNSGGLKKPQPDSGHSRQTLLMKGYSNRWGMALWTLCQLFPIRHELKGHRVVIYSCDFHVPPLAVLWGLITGIKVETHVKGSLSHGQMLELFKNALAHVAISRSDGIPSSTLEAMHGGAIPVQSKTACMEEWIIDGENGSLISIDGKYLRRALSRILSDTDYVERARAVNFSRIREKHEISKVSKSARQAYLDLLGL